MNAYQRDFFRTCDLIKWLDEEQFQTFCQVVDGHILPGRIQRNHFLYQPPDSGGRICFVVSGMLASVFLNPDGSQCPTFFYPPKSICGIPHYLIGDGEMNMGLLGDLPKAHKTTTYMELPVEVFREAEKEIPQLLVLTAKYCASGYMDLFHMCNLLHYNSARKRVGNYLLIRKRSTQYTVMPNFLMRECSITLLADMLGLERSTVSRELHRMQRLGLISLESSSITILDAEKLNEYVNIEY